MKTLFLLLLLSIPCFGQIEQVASSTVNPRGVPLAYYLDRKTVVYNGDKVSFTAFIIAVKAWKDEFEVDPSYFVVSYVTVNCKTQDFIEHRSTGFDQGIFNIESGQSRHISKGSVIQIVGDKLCTQPDKKKLKA